MKSSDDAWRHYATKMGIDPESLELESDGSTQHKEKEPTWSRVGSIVKSLIIGVVSVVIVLTLVALLMALSAFIVMQLWNWFAVPLGAPAIGFWLAMGIDVLITYLVMKPKTRDMTPDELLYVLKRTPITMLSMYGIGWIIHLFL